MMVEKPSPKVVGKFIRERRAALKLSQKALGQLLAPAVTTQFISNIERGVTPLPVSHVQGVAKALNVTEPELMALMEKEFTARLSGKLGHAPDSVSAHFTHLQIRTQDMPWVKSVYDAFQTADEQTRQAFLTVCASILKLKDAAFKTE